jgi:hypothetical protein
VRRGGEPGALDDAHHALDVLVGELTIPRCSSWRRSSPPLIRLRAALRLSCRPAPWQAVPNDHAIAPARPASTNELVPMLPRMKTGWPGTGVAGGGV